MLEKYDRVTIPFDLDLAIGHYDPNWQLSQQIKKLVVEYGKLYPDMTVADLVSVGLAFPGYFKDTEESSDEQ